ncbi:hypothetical protein B0H14DRAFT_1541655 [Mycena olivaceomarginata]|nr:hypothetical protein B0H14DRAFT_1541655 [Mycena olivaceomarginata]
MPHSDLSGRPLVVLMARTLHDTFPFFFLLPDPPLSHAPPTALTFPIATSSNAEAKSRRRPPRCPSSPFALLLIRSVTSATRSTVPAGTMCMRFNLSVRPLVALLFSLLYIRYAPAVVASLNAREPRTELSCTSCRLVPCLSFVAPSLSLCLVLIAPHSLVPSPTLRYAASLVDMALS